MDVKEIIAAIEEKLGDLDFKDALTKNPLGVIEDLVGDKIPEDKLKEIIEAIKDKVDLGDLADMAKDAVEKLGGLDEVEKKVGGFLSGLLHKK